MKRVLRVRTFLRNFMQKAAVTCVAAALSVFLIEPMLAEMVLSVSYSGRRGENTLNKCNLSEISGI
jgi:hypothetical protein